MRTIESEEAPGQGASLRNGAVDPIISVGPETLT
jgi:hypothetical protein